MLGEYGCLGGGCGGAVETKDASSKHFSFSLSPSFSLFARTAFGWVGLVVGYVQKRIYPVIFCVWRGVFDKEYFNAK